MNGQPPPLPDQPRPPARRCLWVGSFGCVTLVVLLAVLIGVLILLSKFVWGLRLDQWL